MEAVARPPERTSPHDGGGGNFGGSEGEATVLHNPFEATFLLLKTLREEIEYLKAELKGLKFETTGRFSQLEANVEALRSAKLNRFDELENAVADMRANNNARFEAVVKTVEQLRAGKNVRFEKLEAALKDEVNDRFATMSSLDKKMRIEVSQLRANCERNGIEFNELRTNTEKRLARHSQDDTDLRQDLEKLKDLVSVNSMSMDPFSGVGYHEKMSGTGVLPSLGASLGSNDTSLRSPANKGMLMPLSSPSSRMFANGT